MKGKILHFILSIAPLSILVVSLNAQQTPSNASFVATAPSKLKAKVASKTDTLHTGRPSAFIITGAVQQIFQVTHPLQCINPFAPKQEGNEYNNLTLDPDNHERPQGVILFGIQW